MGTTLGPKYVPYTYMDPLGNSEAKDPAGALRRPQLLANRYAKLFWNFGMACRAHAHAMPRRRAFLDIFC